MDHPKILKEEKMQILETIFRGKISDEFCGLILPAAEKDRYQELPAILEDALDRIKEYKKIGKASVTSAAPLSDVWKEKIQKKLLEFWKSRGGKLFASDQDVINGTLKGQIHTLMPRYNFFTNYRYFSYRELVHLGKTYKAVTPRELQIAKKHPSIITIWEMRDPGLPANLNHYRRAYELYLAKTPWAGAAKEHGKRTYMLAYHMLDYATAICRRYAVW